MPEVIACNMFSLVLSSSTLSFHQATAEGKIWWMGKILHRQYPIEKCAVFSPGFCPSTGNIRKLRFGAETKPGLQEQWGKITHMDLFLSTSGPGHPPKNCPRHRCRRLRPGGPGQQMGSVNFEKNQGFWLRRPTSPMVARAEAVTFFWASPACGKIHALREAI